MENAAADDETCELDIGPDNWLDWQGEEHVEGGKSVASYLSPDDAVRFLLRMHAQWRTETHG